MVTKDEMDKVFNSPKQGLTLGEFKDGICLYVKLYDWVSIAELKHRFCPQAEGDYALSLPRSPNILLFAGLSELFCKALTDLLLEKRIHPHGANILVYTIDGEMLRLPLAKRMPTAGDYKTPHWLPVTFRLGEKCLAKGCPGGKNKVKVKADGTRIP